MVFQNEEVVAAGNADVDALVVLGFHRQPKVVFHTVRVDGPDIISNDSRMSGQGLVVESLLVCGVEKGRERKKEQEEEGDEYILSVSGKWRQLHLISYDTRGTRFSFCRADITYRRVTVCKSWGH